MTEGYPNRYSSPDPREQAWRAMPDVPGWCFTAHVCGAQVRLSLPTSCCRRNGLWGRNPHSRMLCVEKKLYTPFLPVLQKKEFYVLKDLMLNLFQTRPFGAFQRGFMAALGRQCQRTLDFWSLIWKNVSNSDPTVSFSKFHAIISYCTSSWHYIWSYPSSYPSDGSHELPHLSNSSLS